MKRKSLIAWVVFLFLFLVCGLVAISQLYIHGQVDKLKKLTDVRLFSYEAQVPYVRKIAEVYTITDDTSYQQAKKDIKMSSGMRSKLFPTAHYVGVGTNSVKPNAQVQDIEYVYNPKATYQTYLMHLTVTNPDNTVYTYDIVCIFSKGVLIDLQGY